MMLFLVGNIDAFTEKLSGYTALRNSKLTGYVSSLLPKSLVSVGLDLSDIARPQVRAHVLVSVPHKAGPCALQSHLKRFLSPIHHSRVGAAGQQTLRPLSLPALLLRVSRSLNKAVQPVLVPVDHGIRSCIRELTSGRTVLGFLGEYPDTTI